MSAHPSQPEETRRDHRRLRRVIIEERQQKVLEHVRASAGYSDDVDPRAHDAVTFKLINQRRELDKLPHADYVLPVLDDWKHWTKMNDWDSRNRLLEDLIAKLRRREATPGELEVLIIVCRPQWAKVAASLRRYGGLDASFDPGASGRFRREESQRVHDLDRDELDQVVQHGLMDALLNCPRPFPRFFFKWLESVLIHRALDHIRADISAYATRLASETSVLDVVDAALAAGVDTSSWRSIGSPMHDQWRRTLDLPALFEVSRDYATYARTRSACERAVDRLPDRQRDVVRDHYFAAMTQPQIATMYGLSDSTVRNTHRAALGNLRRDDDLFDVLEAVGKVRDQDRRRALDNDRLAA